MEAIFYSGLNFGHIAVSPSTPSGGFNNPNKLEAFMPVYTCSKLTRGSLMVEIDWANQRLALREDYPVKGNGTGAWYNPMAISQ